ncbi:MAG: NAD(P)H-quinone oxidoreductase [Saprospiraceae bacterium]|nr:NAD(P)H-quinone oxidoreductase [Saprospiraceae bacterium]
MKAILIPQFGGPEVMQMGEWDTPAPGPKEIRVQIKATALNRADTMQRRGVYPPPPGESPILGLEMAGVVEQVGAAVTKWKEGDRVCGLLGGGGYAEYCVTHEDMAIRLPDQLSFVEGAAIPEVFLTAYQALHWLAKIEAGEKVLVHAGASGVGTAAIQLIGLHGANSIVTASAGKHETCLALGASHAIDYKKENFAEAVKELTDGQGVQVIVDFIAAPYFQKNLDSLALEGRLVMLSLIGGVKPEGVNLAPILRKRLQIIGTTLRARSLDYKIALTKDLQTQCMPHFATGKLKPIIDSVIPWTEVVQGHQRMEGNLNTGKIVMEITP